MSSQCRSTTRDKRPCRNAALENGYCRSHNPVSSLRPPTGTQFEERVLKVLRLLGYSVERNLTINGCQIDLYGEYKTGVISLRLMVECKDYSSKKTVGIEEINKFAGVVAVARNMGAIDKGLFVTTQGYTAAAKVNAHKAGIQLATYRELSTQLIDFDSYIEKIKAEFELSSVSKYYIELSGAEVEDYEAEDASVFHRPIDEYISRHLLDGERSKLALLGNFGTGKSTFCRKYAHDLAKDYGTDDTTRIPIVVNLSDYDSRVHIQQLILNTLQFRYNVNITSTLCQELQRIGRFLIMFDGFDEMAARVDADTIRENLRELNKVSEIAENKFILTCRTHFFRDRVQADVLADYELLYIPEWREAELKEYLQKRFGSEWEVQLERIIGTHNLPELAQTPLFLEMIVETLPKLGDEVKRIELYQAYTDTWIKGQSRRKGARLSASQRAQFVEALASKLYIENRLFCHHKEFVSIIRQWFETDDAAQLDYLRSDVQTCTFLIRDSDGNYRFRHRSFMEFFVAKSLAEQIRAGSHDGLSTTVLPLEIRSFLVDFLRPDPPANLLKAWFANTEEPTLRDNILSLLPRLKINIDDIKLNVEPMQKTDVRIATQFLQGDAEAFDALYSALDQPLRRYINRISSFPDHNEDILFDTLFSAWQYRDRLDSVHDLRPYVFRIARNKYYDLLRRERYDLVAPIEADETLAIDDLITPSPEAGFVDRQTVSEALRLLTQREQFIISQTTGQGKTTDEVGRELGITAGAVRQIRARSLAKLRKLLKAKGRRNDADDPQT